MSGSATLPPVYFERMFAENRDPWGFETSAYEKTKYDATLAALAPTYENGFEIGCANGVLTKRLASRCRSLLAIDVSITALARAKTRCADLAGVTFSEMSFPTQRPAESFDLVVMSEVVYYWSVADIAVASRYVGAHLKRGGDLLLVHWIGETDYPQTGDDAVCLLRNGLPQLDCIRADRCDEYRLDLWRRP